MVVLMITNHAISHLVAVAISTVTPTPSPSCEDLEGCLNCALTLSGEVCCSECNGENGFTLNECRCSRGECQSHLTNVS